MSISTDFSKVSLNTFQAEQGGHVTEQEFLQAKQKETQVIKATADSNKASYEDKDNGGRNQSAKDETQNVESSTVEDVNVKMRQLNVGLSFEMTEDGQDNIVKVVDQSSGELVRQIPSEEFLSMSKRLDEIFGELNDLKGTLINNEV